MDNQLQPVCDALHKEGAFDEDRMRHVRVEARQRQTAGRTDYYYWVPHEDGQLRRKRSLKEVYQCFSPHGKHASFRAKKASVSSDRKTTVLFRRDLWVWPFLIFPFMRQGHNSACACRALGDCIRHRVVCGSASADLYLHARPSESGGRGYDYCIRYGESLVTGSALELLGGLKSTKKWRHTTRIPHLQQYVKVY